MTGPEVALLCSSAGLSLSSIHADCGPVPTGVCSPSLGSEELAV